MNRIAFETAVILLLLIANGVFAMAEIAVVSAKKARLRRLADLGNAKARLALDLAESPNRFLSTVQIGITLVGIFAGAFGGATLATELAGWIGQASFLAGYADKIAFAIVVLVITYFSLVIGELVPKRFGLSNPEGIAMMVARPMNWLSRAAGPAVSFLSVSTEGLLRVLGSKPGKEVTVSEEEVRVMMQEGVRAGAFNKVESQIVDSALKLDQLPVREIMTPRPKVIWLNQDDPHEQVWHKIVVSNHSHFPVYRSNRDHTVGTVSVKAIYANLAAGVGVNLKDLMIPPLIVPESQTVLQLVETFKQSGKHIALVTDEFGSMVGLVTLNDLMEAVVGEFPTQGERAKPEAKKREDGSWLIGVFLPDLSACGHAQAGGTFLPLPKLASEPFLKLWEQEVFALLLAEGKITEEVVANIRSWKHSGFSVDQSVRLEAGDRAGIQRLIQYFLRCPFSQARMIEVTNAGKVLYKTGDNRLGRFPEAASDDLLAGPSRNFQIFDPLDFLAEVTQHIPEMGDHLIRRTR